MLAEQCQELIDLATPHMEDAECVNALGQRALSEHRVAQTYLTSPDEVKWLFELCAKLTQNYHNEPRTFSGVEIVRYGEGGFFLPHHDVRPFGGWMAEGTGIIQLSDGDSYEGGELLVLTDEWTRMPRDQGRALMFPASSIHQVMPVTAGERWVVVWWSAERGTRGDYSL